MSTVERLEPSIPHRAAPERVRWLPIELWLFCCAAPVLYLPVFHRRIFEQTPALIALSIAENCLPFLIIPAALQVAYLWVVPRWFKAAWSLPRRLAAHALAATIVAIPVGVVLQQILIRLREKGPPLLGFTLVCVVLTWTLVLPALLVQEYRELARAQQRAIATAELESLQARIRPHFLFNALNTVASLIPNDPALAEATVERLSDFLRYSLRSSGSASVPLEEELNRVRDYLEVQQARFGDRLTFTVSLEPGLESFRVPPLALLPLVENAVTHGITPRIEGGSLHVMARRVGKVIELCVEDRGGDRAPASHVGSGTALADLRRRIALLYGDRSSLRLEANTQGGMTAALTFPETA